MLTRDNQDAVGEDRADGVPISIVVVTYNSAEVLPGLLDCLPAGLEGVTNAEVIIVDNHSPDGSADLAETHPLRPRVIRMGRNAGYAAGINAASSIIGADRALLVLNPDIRLLPGCARVLAEGLTDECVGVAVPQMLHEDRTLAHSIRREPSLITVWSDALVGSAVAARIGMGEIVNDRVLYERGGSVEWATGAALLIAPRARRLVGAWDESFFLYSEEVDFLFKVRRQGLVVSYVPRASVVHIGGEYHRSAFLSALMTTNRIRYFRRHHGWVSTALFRSAIALGSAMRFPLGPGHRAALRAALTP